jgi:hypothetical protein
MIGQPRRGIRQDSHPFRTECGRQVPQAVALSVQPDQDGWRTAPGRQLTHVTAHQHGGCIVPVPPGLSRIPDHAQLRPGGGHNPLNFGAEKA